MMSGEAWLYLLAVLINAVNLFLQVFFTIMYSDLEWYVSSQRPSHIAHHPSQWWPPLLPAPSLPRPDWRSPQDNPERAFADSWPAAITSTPSIFATASTRILSPKPVFTLS
jgi:hypothetical protein